MRLQQLVHIGQTPFDARLVRIWRMFVRAAGLHLLANMV